MTPKEFTKPSTLFLSTALMVALAATTADSAYGAASLLARAEVVASGLGNAPVVDTIGNPAVATDSLSKDSVTSSAQAIATYGDLKAKASILKTSSDPEPFNFATGTAKFFDDLTVTGGTGAGTISLEFALTGSIEDINSGEQRANVGVDVFLPGSFQGYSVDYFVESGTTRTLDETIVTSQFDINFGVPFAIEVALESFVSLEETDTGTATADFLSTMTVTGYSVTGATGPVSVTGDSGYNYPIPEPGSGLLALLGALILLRRRAGGTGTRE